MVPMNQVLIPISILFQFIGIALISTSQPVPGTIVFALGCLSMNFLYWMLRSDEKQKETFISDFKKLKEDVNGLTMTLGFRG